MEETEVYFQINSSRGDKKMLNVKKNCKMIFLLSLVLGFSMFAMDSASASSNLMKNQQIEQENLNNVFNGILSKSIGNLNEDADNFDVSKNWTVLDYKSDLGIPINNIFVQNRNTPGTGIHLASVNFTNIGNGYFVAQKKIKLKKNKTYNMKFLYGLSVTNGAKGSIDFNGDTRELPAENQVYQNIVSTQKDQDFTITMKFETLKYASVYLAVAYDKNDPDGGIKESAFEKPNVKTPEANTNIVEGTAIKGNKIIVRDNSNEIIGRSEVLENGSFSVQTNRLLKYKEQLKVVQVNKLNQESEPAEVTVDDTIAPSKPNIKNIEVSKQMVLGTAEENSIIEAKSEAGVLLGTGKAANNGHVEFKLTKKVDLNDKVLVTATDEAGNVSEATTVLVIDTQAPPAPEVTGVTDETTKVVGNTIKPNCSVTVQIGNQIFKTTSNDTGYFEINLNQTFSAGTEMVIFSKDASGNKSPNRVIKVTSEKITKKPLVRSLGDSDLVVTGESEKKAKIEAVIGEDVYQQIADENGHFEIKLNKTYSAGIKYSVTATGASGKKSEPFSSIVIDNTPPDSPKLNKFTDADTILTGKTEANSIVDIYIEEVGLTDKKHYQVIANAQTGEFTVDLEKRFRAGSKIEATATDTAGNKSVVATEKVMNSIKLDISIPDITSQDDTISGGKISRPYGHYVIKINNQIFEGNANEQGEFTVSLPHYYEAGTAIKCYAIDGDERSDVTDKKVRPRFPSLDAISKSDDQIKGVVDPEANVELVLNEKKFPSVKADVEGKFIFKLDTPLKTGDKIKVTQTKNGVSSRTAETVVHDISFY
ncbi:Ig-like domain-containing protein [Enterococcus faecalis]|uniref:Ig-like domain-containing protein n=1 Tax=Enterococcus faecalis TaxID=1351 RepID=UPI003D14DB72